MCVWSHLECCSGGFSLAICFSVVWSVWASKIILVDFGAWSPIPSLLIWLILFLFCLLILILTSQQESLTCSVEGISSLSPQPPSPFKKIHCLKLSCLVCPEAGELQFTWEIQFLFTTSCSYIWLAHNTSLAVCVVDIWGLVLLRLSLSYEEGLWPACIIGISGMIASFKSSVNLIIFMCLLLHRFEHWLLTRKQCPQVLHFYLGNVYLIIGFN